MVGVDLVYDDWDYCDDQDDDDCGCFVWVVEGEELVVEFYFQYIGVELVGGYGEDDVEDFYCCD